MRYRLNDYYAYYTKLLKEFERSLEQHTAVAKTYPEPCKLCEICPWRNQYHQQRLADDHLSQVANITKTQIVKLAKVGVTTMKGLAQLDEQVQVKGIQEPTLVRLVDQAALQVHEKETGEQIAKCLIEVEYSKGFSRLRHPDEGDLFFDMEGDLIHEE